MISCLFSVHGIYYFTKIFETTGRKLYNAINSLPVLICIFILLPCIKSPFSSLTHFYVKPFIAFLVKIKIKKFSHNFFCVLDNLTNYRVIIYLLYTL